MPRMRSLWRACYAVKKRLDKVCSTMRTARPTTGSPFSFSEAGTAPFDPASLVSTFLANSIQQIHSLRARGVMSCHVFSAFTSEVSAFFRSAEGETKSSVNAAVKRHGAPTVSLISALALSRRYERGRQPPRVRTNYVPVAAGAYINLPFKR